MALVDQEGRDVVSAPPKVAIAVPAYGYTPPQFTIDLANMCMFMGAKASKVPGMELGLVTVMHTYIHRARQQLLEGLMAQGASHIIWVDSDMRFPKDAVGQLLRHDCDLVGINYVNRSVEDMDFIAIKKTGPEGAALVTNRESTGLEEVEAVGFGLVMLRTSALRDLPADEPWFWFDRDEHGNHIGEDVYFCNLFRSLGKKIYVDHDLSKQCSHIGDFEYRLEHMMTREEMYGA